MLTVHRLLILLFYFLFLQKFLFSDFILFHFILSSTSSFYFFFLLESLLESLCFFILNLTSSKTSSFLKSHLFHFILSSTSSFYFFFFFLNLFFKISFFVSLIFSQILFFYFILLTVPLRFSSCFFLNSLYLVYFSYGQSFSSKWYRGFLGHSHGSLVWVFRVVVVFEEMGTVGAEEGTDSCSLAAVACSGNIELLLDRRKGSCEEIHDCCIQEK